MSDSILPDRGEPPQDAAPPDAPPDAPPGERLEYDGAGGALARIVITNSLLTLATLGVYRFWGKTRVRRYLWSRVSFLGDRFEYTGTGRELFFGFLIALVALALVFGLPVGIEIALGIGHPAYWTAEAISVIVLLFLVFFAHYRARRYRLSRTEWRGIRFGQDGSSIRYAFLALAWAAVAVVTLGLAYPVYRTRLQRFRIRHSMFGDHRLEFDGRAAALFKPWLLAWFLHVPTLGIIYIWYRVREFRYFAGSTRCGALSFASDLKAGKIVIVFIVYYFVAVLLLILLGGAIFGLSMALFVPDTGAEVNTGGVPIEITPGIRELAAYVVVIAIFLPVFELLAAVILIHPICREVVSSLRVIGDEDYEGIAQSSESMPRRGEGLADALDVGAV